jgi:hypothetical protein
MAFDFATAPLVRLFINPITAQAKRELLVARKKGLIAGRQAVRLSRRGKVARAAATAPQGGTDGGVAG